MNWENMFKYTRRCKTETRNERIHLHFLVTHLHHKRFKLSLGANDLNEEKITSFVCYINRDYMKTNTFLEVKKQTNWQLLHQEARPVLQSSTLSSRVIASMTQCWKRVALRQPCGMSIGLCVRACANVRIALLLTLSWDNYAACRLEKSSVQKHHVVLTTEA